MTFAFF